MIKSGILRGICRYPDPIHGGNEKMSILYKSTRGVDGLTVTASQAILQGNIPEGCLFCEHPGIFCNGKMHL